MFTVKRSATAVAALALLLTACGGADGDVTTTDPGSDADTPRTSPSPDPAGPDADVTPAPDESPESRETPPQPPDEGSGETEPPAEDTGDSGSAGEPATDLTVTFDPGNGDVSEWTVTCEPAGGTIGDPEAACGTLNAMSPRDVAPVPKDAACTMQYGGPQTATITGRWDGTKVDLSFSRQNGCEINRWDKMDPVIPAGEAAEL